jgi:hypothetical protein
MQRLLNEANENEKEQTYHLKMNEQNKGKT